MTPATEAWLAEATKGLVPEAEARVNAMYRDYAEPPTEDAATANRRFQKTYATERDLLFTGVARNRLIASIVILNAWFGLLLWGSRDFPEVAEQWNALAALLGSVALAYSATMIWGFRRAFPWFGWLGVGLRNEAPHKLAFFLCFLAPNSLNLWRVIIESGWQGVLAFIVGMAFLPFFLRWRAARFRAKLYATYTQPELDALAQRLGFTRIAPTPAATVDAQS